MIKVNLLESVTDRPKGVAMVEDKVSTPRIQTLLMALTVFGLLALGAGFDYISANTSHGAAQKELENQKRINNQMLAVNREQAELEKKAGDIQGRIDAIKRLRESQQGPGSVLQEIKVRFDNVPELYLKSIDQKDGEITIKGESPNEYAVTRFGQSIEFSGGLFTNLNIETERVAGLVSNTPDTISKPEVVAFTVKCNYTPPKTQSQPTTPVPANQVAMKK